MCRALSPASIEDENAGLLYLLCGDHGRRVAHVMEIAGVQFAPYAPGTKAPMESGTSADSRALDTGPGRGLYGAFCTLGKTLMVEFNYFDLDHRSEVAELQEWAFQQLQPTSIRLHFFSVEAREGEGHRKFLKRVVEGDPANLAEGVDPSVPHYLGYSVVRGRPGDAIGRSIVSPYANIDSDVKLDYRVVHSQVRTAVTEHINVFGVPLVAVGIPFMEQQGSLVRCSHVSAWICHYTATLRGFVPRRSISHFHRMGGTYAAGRTFPSAGLTAHEIVQILGRSDMPAEVLDATTMSVPRELNWTDRAVLATRLAEAKEVVDAAADRQSGAAEVDVWVRENLSAAVCRYLNSGIPVMVLASAEEHTQVIVGYVRRSDHEDGVQSLPAFREGHTDDEDHADDLDDLSRQPELGAADEDGRSDVEYFIVADDQHGPFELVSVEKLAGWVRRQRAKVLVPLPKGLSMTGRSAEKLGVRLLSIYMGVRVQAVRGAGGPSSVEEEALLAFHDHLSTKMSEKYTVRTYATTGIDLKASVSRRLGDVHDITRTLSMQPMPKFVWVMEVIDRQRRRDRRRESVRAMVVLDASQVLAKKLDDETLLTQMRPVFLHYPGTINVVRPLNGNDEAIPATFDAYSTGRWDHKYLLDGSAERIAVHSKGAASN